MEFLLDSVVLIDHFNDIPEATAYLAEVEGKAAISIVTRAEVLTGFDADSREEAEFLDEFPLLEITKPIADLTANLRRKHGWKLPDASLAVMSVSSYRVILALLGKFKGRLPAPDQVAKLLLEDV